MFFLIEPLPWLFVNARLFKKMCDCDFATMKSFILLLRKFELFNDIRLLEIK